MNTTRTLGIGLVSVGWMGKLHAHAYQQLPLRFPDLGVRPRFVMAADTAPERTAIARDLLGFMETTADYRELLARDDIDVVSVCAPNFLHHEIGTAVARAGKHLWIEKPVGRGADETHDLLDIVRDHGLVTSIGYNYRHAPALALLRDEVWSGRLGRIMNFRSSFFNSYAADPHGARSWRFERAFAGAGASADLLSHVIDLVQHILGPVGQICAQKQTFIAERPIPPQGVADHFATVEGSEMAAVENDDYMSALTRIAGGSADGAMGTIEASRVVTHPQVGIGIEVYGTEGTACWDFERMNELRIGRRGAGDTGMTTVVADPVMPGYSAFQPGRGNPMSFDDLKVIEARKFVEAVLAGADRDNSTVGDAASVADVLTAAERSVADGGFESVRDGRRDWAETGAGADLKASA